jgi:uncharacterized membrane protein
MTNQFKNFFSVSFSILAIASLVAGFYFIPSKGWDISQYYFYAGFVMAVVAQFIELSMAEDDN